MAKRADYAHLGVATNADETRMTAIGNATETRREVAAYCARPSCNAEFPRGVGAGKVQRYCSEPCRRAAQTEKRHLEARLRDLESSVRQQRHLLAAYDLDDLDGVPHGSSLARAREALAGAQGVLRFVATSDEPLAAELRTVVQAMEPLIVEMASGIAS